MQRGKKKTILILLLIVLSCGLLLWIVQGFSAGETASDCREMAPVPAQKDASYITLDFSDKERISMTKYGFRNEIVAEVPSVIVQNVGAPPTAFAYFGLFKDKELKEPIEVVDFKWLYRDGPFEEGEIDEVPYDPEKDGIITVDAGTYYAAVYTNNPLSSLEVSYKCQICPLNEMCSLEPGKKAYFYGLKEKQKNVFRITAQKDGTVYLSSNIFNSGLIKVYDEDGKLLREKYAEKNQTKGLALQFAVKKGERYSVEITGLPVEEESFGMYLHWIRYSER